MGKTQRMWEGGFNVYVRQADGREKRLRRSRILGPCASMTKYEDELRERRVRRQACRDDRLNQAAIPRSEDVKLVKRDPKGCRARL